LNTLSLLVVELEVPTALPAAVALAVIELHLVLQLQQVLQLRLPSVLAEPQPTVAPLPELVAQIPHLEQLFQPGEATALVLTTPQLMVALVAVVAQETPEQLLGVLAPRAKETMVAVP
jgi:hypothetical protein